MIKTDGSRKIDFERLGSEGYAVVMDESNKRKER